MRSRAMIALVVLSALVICAFAPTAGAVGTFEVTPSPCNSWGGYASNGWSNGIYCTGYAAFQLNSGNGVAVGTPGTFMWRKSPRLPDAIFLKSLKLSYLSSEATGSADHIQARACQRYVGQIDAWSAASNGACVGAVFGLPTRDTFTSLTLGEGTLACGTNCGGFQIDVSSSYRSGFVWVGAITATIGDNTAPAVTSLFASHEISQGNWMRGTVEIGATGADPNGSGIASMAFFPGDLTISVSTGASCDFSQWIPCAASKGWTGAFDTSGVSDGPHLGYYTATDPAGRTGQSQSFSFKTDNTRPTTPSAITPVTNGLNGWSSVNSVGANWVNGAEVEETATQSGLDGVIVDVNPTDGAQSDPAPVKVPIGGSASGISASRTSISGLALPAAGAWTLRLQLVDKAGNVSEVGDGYGASPDSDVLVGYDPNPPATPQGQANGWISRDELAAGFDQEFTYSAPPTTASPVCGFAGAIDENINGVAGSTINVSGGGSVRRWRLPGTLTEDTHYVHLRSVGCNGIASPMTETVTAPVDRTDPVGTITGVENGKWYKSGQVVELRGSDVLSGMAPAPAIDDDSRKGAYLSYTINSSGPADNFSPRGNTTSLPITGEGQKDLRFSPVDLAGNKAPAKATSFGIDATNPNGFINHQDPARPTLLSAQLSDAPSGVSYAIFSVRAAGSSDNDWIQLPTSIAGPDDSVFGAAVASGTATARFPDTSLGQGTFDVRVEAFDQAGNPLSTQRYQDGSHVQVQNPMRSATAINVKLLKALRTCGKRHCAVKKCTKQSKGACYKILKGKVILQGGSTTMTSAYNRGAIATGVLTDASGNPIRNTDVAVSTTTKVTGKAFGVGAATTDSHGIWALRVPAGVNRTVKATYEGTELRRPTSSTATMNTQAKLKLKVSRKRAKTGQSITFSGTVTPADAAYPSGGKIVALQFYAAKQWRPAVGVDHTDKNGKFKLIYKFDGRKVKAKIIFRVVAPAEDAWGHAFSASKPVSIKLNY